MSATRNLLAIAPPYFTSGAPPLGPASLLAYLRANGCDDFEFLDLRLWVPNAYAPTYRAVGVFGETYVMDVPDLPLVLSVLDNVAKGRGPLPDEGELFDRFCLERGMSPGLLSDYLRGMNRFLAAALEPLPALRFVGFSVWSSNYLTTLMAAAHLKVRPNPPFVVLGGPQTTESGAAAKLALRSGLADAVALGEGEETLLRLYEATAAANGSPATTIPGTMRYDSQTGAFESAERPLLRLAQLPLPAFDKLPLPSYRRGHHSHRTVTYELSRGCTDKCVFCSEWVFWKRIRTDDAAHVVDNVVQLQRRFGCEAVWFMDSLLNATMGTVRRFAEELLRRDVLIRWGGYLRANVDPETAALLKRAGCEFVFVGIESLSDETLELMNKRRTGADNIDALDALLGADIDRVVAGLIPGFPGDTRERFTQTALLLADVHRRYPGRFRVNVEPFVISPKQPMYTEIENYGLTPLGWDEPYLDIAPQYRDITAGVLCSVAGSNQGIDRLGELRVAQAVTAVTANQPDPFMYYEGETVTSAELRLSEMFEGWYLGLMKTDSALVYGLILNAQERSELERLQRSEMVGSGYGYGRKPQSSLFGREPFDSFLRTVEGRHLVPPRRNRPGIRPGFYRHRPPQADEEVGLSPFAVSRIDGAVLVADAVTGMWLTVDEKWASLFGRLAAGPQIVGALTGDDSSAATEIERLLEAGVLWVTAPALEAASSEASASATGAGRHIPLRVEAAVAGKGDR